MILDQPPTQPPTTRRQAAQLLGTWAASLGAAAAVLVLNLQDLHPPPVISSPAVWNDWVLGQDPDDVVAALVAPFALAVVVATALVVVVAAAVVAIAVRRGRAVRCPDRWPVSVSTFVTAVALVVGGAGAPSAGASTGSGAQAGGEVDARPVVELVRTAERPAVSVTTSAVPAPTTPLPVAPPVDPAVDPDPAPQRPATYLVRPGDNLWRIAEQQVVAQPELGPTVRYWLRLIDANRSRFVEPGNPHLILPGQVLDLPGQ